MEPKAVKALNVKCPQTLVLRPMSWLKSKNQKEKHHLSGETNSWQLSYIINMATDEEC